MKTLIEFIKELQEMADTYGEGVAVETPEGEDPTCEVEYEDPSEEDNTVIIG